MKISEYAESLGIHVSTWRPGDGVTRYRFHRESSDYNSGNAITTVLGRKDAETWLNGFKAGRQG